MCSRKPIARTERELADVKDVWLQSGRHRREPDLRAAPLYLQLRDLIARGELGGIYAIDGDYLYGRLERLPADGAPASTVTGHGRRRRAPGRSDDVATGQRHVSERHRPSHRDREHSVSLSKFSGATFRFASGLIGRITANFGCVHRHQHVLRVFGTRGTFIYDDRGARLHMSRDPDTSATSLDAAPLAATKGALLPEFVRTVRSGHRDEAATQLHFDVLSACAAADRAAAAAAFLEIHYV